MRQFLLPLPDNLEPLEVKCIRLEIPDDPLWQASFWGFLEGLAHWFTWERDSDHTGAIMAEKYRAIIEQARLDMENGACNMGVDDVRQNPLSPCILEKKIDGGDWMLFANLQLCTPKPKMIPLQWGVHDGYTAWSPDGGVTFYEFPDGDPTTGTTADDFGVRTPTYATGVDKQCVAAENVVSLLRQEVGQIADALAVSGVVLAITAIILAAVAIVVTSGLAAVAIVMAAEVVTISYVDFVAYWTDDVYDTFLCDLYNAFNADGIIDADGFKMLYDTESVKTEYPWRFITLWLSLRGVVGIQNSVNAAAITDCTTNPCDAVNITSPDGMTFNITRAVVGDTVIATLAYGPALWYQYNGTAVFSDKITANVTWHDVTATGPYISTVTWPDNSQTTTGGYQTPTGEFKGIGGNSGTAGYIEIEILTIG